MKNIRASRLFKQLQFLTLLLCITQVMPLSALEEKVFPLVLAGGRVIDPETGLDAVRDVAIADGKIVAVSETPLKGSEVIDVTGLVVAPGFIDLHTHSPTLLGQDYLRYSIEARVGRPDRLPLCQITPHGLSGVKPCAEILSNLVSWQAADQAAISTIPSTNL